MSSNLQNDFEKIVNSRQLKPSSLERSSAVWPVRFGRDIARFNMHIGPRQCSYYHLIFVLDGEGTFVSKGKRYALRKYDIICLFPQVTYEYFTVQEAPLQRAWITFEGPQAAELLARIGFKPCTPHLKSQLNAGSVRNILELFELYHNPGEHNGDLVRLIAFFKLFEELSRDAVRDEMDTECGDTWMLRAKEYMDLHYMENMTIEQVAEASGVDRAYFTRKFHQTYGLPPGKYLQQLKIEQSKRLLAETTLNLSAISQSVGYTDMFSFSKAFKRMTGMPPTQYRL